MSQDSAGDFDALLTRLEATIELLAVGTAPIDELVTAYERATRLLATAQARFAELQARANQTSEFLAE